MISSSRERNVGRNEGRINTVSGGARCVKNLNGPGGILCNFTRPCAREPSPLPRFSFPDVDVTACRKRAVGYTPRPRCSIHVTPPLHTRLCISSGNARFVTHSSIVLLPVSCFSSPLVMSFR